MKNGYTLNGCVVINERGLVVAHKSIIPISGAMLAAMVALASKTAFRINENLSLGEYEAVSITSSNGVLSVCDFPVGDKVFRIGAITATRYTRRFFRTRKLEPSVVEEDLSEAAREVCKVLES
jgi:predicted regulator of Ras-like GTPase activity (Roadblock/LC7/MglB family)